MASPRRYRSPKCSGKNRDKCKSPCVWKYSKCRKNTHRKRSVPCYKYNKDKCFVKSECIWELGNKCRNLEDFNYNFQSNEQLKNDLNTCNSNLAELQNKYSDNLQQLNSLKNIHSDIKQKFEINKRELEQLKKDNAELKKLEQVNTQVLDITKKYDTAVLKNNLLEEQLENNNREYRELQDRFEYQSGILKNIKQDFESELERLEKSERELSKKLERSDLDCDNLRRKYDEIERKYKTLEIQFKNRLSEKDTYALQLLEEQKQISRANTELKNNYAILEAENKKLKSAVDANLYYFKPFA